MATTETSILQQGARVRVVRGSMPLEAAVVGREGTVVDSSPYAAHRYGVVLDGEARIRYFAAEELVPAEGARLDSGDRQAARKRLVRP